MKMDCVDVQDVLPELVTSRLSAEVRGPVEAHLAACAECGEVFDTLRLLALASPAVPDGLEARIQAAVREASRPGVPARPRWRRMRAPAWALAAAAVVTLVFGRTLLPGPGAGPDFVALGESDLTLLLDETQVAGAPVLDDLTDEELTLLLAEFEG